MKRLQKLLTEISALTLKIEQEYPELYQHLNETPVTLKAPVSDKIDTQNFSDYLESLKLLLEHHIQTHPDN
ncbi:hypothetical protein SAMN05216474_0037 [Lishizhenia tianjinensis]|uniref:Uncharacterized protein n=1 Tax=Lishizhenia tianjinensis TaxID=477690 RepID=A0A1I6XA57_9FLAO|nr:hypothetical protein [Lishizhenia tianjinensis]SFT35023.1 hypothetical protein SAMN05216474_0037 [Lishizhenia tianjinensis]